MTSAILENDKRKYKDDATERNERDKDDQVVQKRRVLGRRKSQVGCALCTTSHSPSSCDSTRTRAIFALFLPFFHQDGRSHCLYVLRVRVRASISVGASSDALSTRISLFVALPDPRTDIKRVIERVVDKYRDRTAAETWFRGYLTDAALHAVAVRPQEARCLEYERLGIPTELWDLVDGHVLGTSVTSAVEHCVKALHPERTTHVLLYCLLLCSQRCFVRPRCPRRNSRAQRQVLRLCAFVWLFRWVGHISSS